MDKGLRNIETRKEAYTIQVRNDVSYTKMVAAMLNFGSISKEKATGLVDG